MTWGIIPAAGNGLRIQPLAFSKELLPVGSRIDSAGVERPRAVSEYLVERMVRGGANKLCFVISPWKSDILQYYGGAVAGVDIAYTIQSQPSGLCDAIFCAVPLVHPDEAVLVGLPDTVWFPEDAFGELPDNGLSLLLFEVHRPELFDAVIMDDDGLVREIQVKSSNVSSNWIWGGFKMPGHVLHALHALWLRRDRQDEYVGTLLNAWLAEGNAVHGICAGEHYVDVGTLGGYREALQLLGNGPGRADRPAFLPAARSERDGWQRHTAAGP
jgi:glucose-1-phosphate thymidylyltransferase